MKDLVSDGFAQVVKPYIDAQHDALTNDIAQIKAHKYLFIGDSFNTIYPGEGWDVEMINQLGLTSDDYFRINIGGAGFCTSPSWTDALTNRLSLIDDKESYKDIIIGSGGNDKAYSLADTISAMQSFKTVANANFPNADIHVGYLAWTGIASDHAAFRTGLNTYIEACDAVGFKYLHNVEYVLHWQPYLRDNTSVTPGDYLHPTSDGLVALGRKMTQAYQTGECHVKYSDLITFDADGTNCSNIAGSSVSAALDNDIVNVIMSPQTLSMLIDVAAGSGKVVGSFSCDCFNPASLLVPAIGRDLTNNAIIPMTIAFQNGSFVIAPATAGIIANRNTQLQQNNYMFLTTGC